MKMICGYGLALVAALALPAQAEGKKEGGHEHHAPHGGTLVVFGEEAAHIELVLDPKTGALTLYVLDGEAEKAVRIKQEAVVIGILWPAARDGEERKTSTVTLKAVARALTGEKVGDTSEFAVKLDELKDAKEWDGEVVAIEIQGKTYEKVKFNFPKGNEGDHDDHDHDDHDHDHDHDEDHKGGK